MNPWNNIKSELAEHFEAEDCMELWEKSISEIFHDLSFLCTPASKTCYINVRVGRCSHWLRPHQTRWTADGGFAWPSGYMGSSYSRTGSPGFDWSTSLTWNPVEKAWAPYWPRRYSHVIYIRVTVPSRTKRHPQAAIPVTLSGSPLLPDNGFQMIYGYRNGSDGWGCTATYNGDSDIHFEKAAEHSAE